MPFIKPGKARAWFLEITFMQALCVCVCVCSGVILTSNFLSVCRIFSAAFQLRFMALAIDIMAPVMKCVTSYSQED